MKKLISILLITAAVVTALCVWQKNNIKALFLFLTEDEEGVNRILEETEKTLDEKIKEYAPVTPRYFTPEEEAKIASGEITIDEAISIILDEERETGNESPAEEKVSSEENETSKEETVSGEKNPDKTDEKTPVSEKKNPGNTEEKKTGSDKPKVNNSGSTADAIIKNYTAQFYALKAYYIGQLNQLESAAKSEYINARKEKKSGVSKTSVAAKYIGKASALQSECDGKVAALLDAMKSELKATGGNLSVIDTIRQTYEAEKAARKAQYMNMIK